MRRSSATFSATNALTYDAMAPPADADDRRQPLAAHVERKVSREGKGARELTPHCSARFLLLGASRGPREAAGMRAMRLACLTKA